MGRRGLVEGLPEDVRRWLERALMDSSFSGYEALQAMLAERGYVMSKSAIHRYGQKIEKRFAAIKASTEAARLLVEGAADDQDARSEAVISMLQSEMFEAILNLQTADSEELNPAERIGLLAKAMKDSATLARASVNQKKFRHEVEEETRRKLLAEQAKQLEAVQKKGGVTADTLAAIREALGIK